MITNMSDSELGVKVVSEPYGYFDIIVPDKIAPGEKGNCLLTVRPDHLEESFEKSITIELDDPNGTHFTIPVIRRLIGASAVAASRTTPTKKITKKANSGTKGDKSGGK